MSSLSVTVLPAGDGGGTIVRLDGEADLTTTVMRDALTAEVASRPRLLAIDMTALTFIDSAATPTIVGAYHVLTRDGGTLALVSPGPSVGRALELLGVNRLIPVYDSMDEAFASAGRPANRAAPAPFQLGYARSGRPPAVLGAGREEVKAAKTMMLDR